MNQIKEPLRKISAVIITYNEEKNIARCIDSLIGIVDEVVVIDSFSTDKTEEICKSKDVIFIHHGWEGYSKSKNFGNQQATNDLILSIDADEELSEDLQNNLLELKNKNKVFEAYTVNRRTNFCGNWINHSGWYPDQKLRFWNRNQGKWEGEIHEKVKLNDGITIGHLKGDLLHYSYHTISDLTIQIEKFSTISSRSDFQKGKQTSFLGIYIHAIGKIFKKYLVQKGFMDGKDGILIAITSGYATFLKYSKLYMLQKGREK